MKIRWVNKPQNDFFIDSVQQALEIANAAVLSLGGKGNLLKRDFCAGVITSPDREYSMFFGDSWDDFVSGAVLCEFWLGNPESYMEAKRDYLANARSKTFTAWRHRQSNIGILMHYRDMLVAEDSLWGGSYYSTEKKMACGVSGQEPAQDLWLAGFILHSYGSFFDYKSRWPEIIDKEVSSPASDLMNGSNFNYPPDFSIFE